MDVTGKVALVTGGGRGIGRGIALALAENGGDVAVADINDRDAERVAAEAEEMGRSSTACHVDVTDQGSVEQMARAVVERFGRIDILVNNAGVVAAAGWESRETVTQEDWDVIFAVNVEGVARVTEVVSRHMKERRYGKIVNIASVAGRQGTLTSLPYGASKAGVINLTQATALNLAPFDINVNAICPGLLWTPMWQRIGARFGLVEKEVEGLEPREVFDHYVKARTPLGREQTPSDIGNLATFLASDYARNITGQAINVNGGSHMS